MYAEMLQGFKQGNSHTADAHFWDMGHARVALLEFGCSAAGFVVTVGLVIL